MFEPKQAKKMQQGSYQNEEMSEICEDPVYLSTPFIMEAQQKLNELLRSKEQMSVFIKNAEQKKIELCSNLIYKYCGKYSNIKITSKDVQNLLNKRLERYRKIQYFRMIKNRRIKRNWNQEDIDILVWAVTSYASLNCIETVQAMTLNDWKNIAELIPGTTGESCMFKVLGLKKIRLSEQKWTQNQSNLLFQIVKQNKNLDWKTVSQELFSRNKENKKIYRTSKQCKEHWTCYLNPQLKKGPWSFDEDIQLLELVKENNGRKKWSDMTKFFKGRTENALKNRYSLILEKEKNNNSYINEIQQLNYVIDLLKNRQRKEKRLKNKKQDIPNSSSFNQFDGQQGVNDHKQQIQVKKEFENFIKAEIIQAGPQYDQNFPIPNSNPIYPSILCTGNQFFVLFNQLSQFM